MPYQNIWVFGCLGVRAFAHVPTVAARPADVPVIWVNVNIKQARQKDLPETLQDAQEFLGRNGTLLVHCYQGKHRTGAFVGVLLVPRAM